MDIKSNYYAIIRDSAEYITTPSNLALKLLV
jgi:hypothetical protein